MYAFTFQPIASLAERATVSMLLLGYHWKRCDFAERVFGMLLDPSDDVHTVDGPFSHIGRPAQKQSKIVSSGADWRNLVLLWVLHILLQQQRLILNHPISELKLTRLRSAITFKESPNFSVFLLVLCFERDVRIGFGTNRLILFAQKIAKKIGSFFVFFFAVNPKIDTSSSSQLLGHVRWHSIFFMLFCFSFAIFL